jgi:uncharacterized protein YbjQ (UPF0145 family)
MRHFWWVFIMAVLLLGGGRAQARDTELHPKIADVFADAELKQKLGTDIRFFFGNQPTPPVKQSFGDFVTNRKTDSVGRPDEVACRWAMLSALIELRDRAKSLGGDAVINIVSYYKKHVASSTSQYECHAGNIIAGVALKGTVVKLASGSAAINRGPLMAKRTTP